MLVPVGEGSAPLSDEVFPAADRIRRVSAHVHDVHHLVLYCAGSGSCEVGERRYGVDRGDLVLVSPQQPHQFGHQQHASQRYRSLTFRLFGPSSAPVITCPDYLSLLLGRVCTASPVTHLSEGACVRLEALFERVLVCGLDGSPRYRVQVAILDLLVEVVEATQGVRLASPGGDEALTRAWRLMEGGYDRPLQVADLAAEAGMSPGHFHRRFRAVYGVSPKAWLLALRVRAARGLLRTTALSVGAVGAAVGFEDPYAFSRCFRRKVGVSPRMYRERS